MISGPIPAASPIVTAMHARRPDGVDRGGRPASPNAPALVTMPAAAAPSGTPGSIS